MCIHCDVFYRRGGFPNQHGSQDVRMLYVVNYNYTVSLFEQGKAPCEHGEGKERAKHRQQARETTTEKDKRSS